MRKLWAAGAAMSVCLALGGVPALAQDASPVPAKGEVVYEITVPPEAIPDALGKIVVDEWTVASGIDVSIPYDNEGILGRGMYLESGGLTVTPAYDALLWTGEAVRGGSPVIAPAAEGVALAAGDVLLLPAVPRDQLDPAAEVGIANPGTSDAQVFAFHMHWWESFPGWPEGIRSTPGITFGLWDELTRVRGGDTTFRLTRLTPQPGEALPFPDDAAFVFDYLKSGALSDWTILGSGPKVRAVEYPRPQHIVAGDVPAEVLELAVIPSVETVTAEPEASAPAAEEAAAASPIIVTGTEVCGDRTGGTSSSLPGIDSSRGWVAECVNTMSDPRVDGTYVNTLNMDCYPSGMCLLWGTHVLDGPEGGWDCSWAGSLYPNDLGGFMVSSVCPGTGGFAGLTYVMQHGNASFEGGSPFGDDSTFDGVIYEGPAPTVFATQSEAGK